MAWPITTNLVNILRHLMTGSGYCWCIDKGHGAKTKGRRSPDGTFFEAEFNHAVGDMIIERLSALGIEYFDVVPDYLERGNDVILRTDRANNHKTNKPKIFVSIHANAPGPQSLDRDGWADDIAGIETWHYNTSIPGRIYAGIFQKHLIEKTGARSRGLKFENDEQFYVLRNTKMPAILTENGFFTNRGEVALLKTDSYRRKIAEAHVEAILEIEKAWFGSGS